MSQYSQGPPPGGPGPCPGQQPWVPYPGQRPGMPMAPPPKRGRGLLWTVLGLVVVLIAAGAAYLVLRGSDDGGDSGPNGGARDGTDQDGGECTGDYCIGGYRYVNACRVFDPSSVVTLIGSTGTGTLQVQEIYADPLPTAEDPSKAAWTYGLTSSCDVRPEDRDGAVFRSVSLRLEQTATEADAPSTQGRPLDGADGAVVEDLDGRAVVRWPHRNISATLDVTWTNRKPAIPDATLAAAVQTITKGLADPVSEPRGLGDLSEGGERVITDACTVFTGEDFQSVTEYAVDPTNVRRSYSTTPSALLRATCSRTTASSLSDLPAPEGTTILDGSMSPRVEVIKHPDPASAVAELDRNRDRIDGAVDIPGVGDRAVFGVNSGGHFTLQFSAASHLVVISCGLSNGNADWTPEDMRSRLEPLAKAIVTRMG